MPHQTFTNVTWFLKYFRVDSSVRWMIHQVARTSALLAAAKFKIIPFLEVGEGSLPVRRSEKLKLGEVYIGAPTTSTFFFFIL